MAVFKHWAGGGVFLLAVLLADAGHAGGRGEKIQISDPSSPIIVSNLNRLDTGKSAFKQVEDDLFKSFQSPGDSMQPMMTPPFRPMGPAPLTPHQREVIEQRRNWAFVDPNDQFPKDELEIILQGRRYGADGKEIIYLDPIQKYYEGLNSQHGPTAAELDASPGAGRNRDFAGTNMFNPKSFIYGTNLPPGWSYALGADTDKDSAPAAGTAGAGDSTAMTAAEKARDLQRHLEFGRLLEGHYDAKPPAPSALPAAPGAPAGLPGPVPNLMGDISNPSATAVPVEYRNAANPILGASVQLPTVQNHMQDDPTLRALGLPQPEVKPPPPTPKPTPPPIIFSPPQRKIM